MRVAVLDTTVIIKWFHRVGEDDLDAARVLREAYLNGDLDITIPDLLLYEFANVLRFKTRLDQADTAEMIRSLWMLGLTVSRINHTLVSSMVDIAYRYNLTIYDAAFVALAQNLPATFVTADRTLYEKTKELGGIVLLSEL